MKKRRTKFDIAITIGAVLWLAICVVGVLKLSPNNVHYFDGVRANIAEVYELPQEKLGRVTKDSARKIYADSIYVCKLRTGGYLSIHDPGIIAQIEIGIDKYEESCTNAYLKLLGAVAITLIVHITIKVKKNENR